MQENKVAQGNIDVQRILSTQIPLLLTVRQFSEKHPCFSHGSLRNLIFLSKSRQCSAGEIAGNGLDQALIRVGKKVLINEARFFEWLEHQSNG